MIGRRSILAAMAALALASAGAATAAETIPAQLQPVGYKALFTTQASGVQIYASVAGAGGARWVLEAPLARLTTGDGKIALVHYAGPSWEASDGSKVVRDTAMPLIAVPAPDAAADIPWLLIKVTADPAPGVLSQVSFVQRIVTHGGAAPATPPVRVGTKIGVPYTATYVFYAKGS